MIRQPPTAAGRPTRAVTCPGAFYSLACPGTCYSLEGDEKRPKLHAHAGLRRHQPEHTKHMTQDTRHSRNNNNNNYNNKSTNQ